MNCSEVFDPPALWGARHHFGERGEPRCLLDRRNFAAVLQGASLGEKMEEDRREQTQLPDTPVGMQKYNYAESAPIT
jgi:hypothetical protein